MSLGVNTTWRLALLAGVAVLARPDGALAQDATFTNTGVVASYTIPTPTAPNTYTLVNTGRIGNSSVNTTGNVAISSGTGTGSIVIQHNAQPTYDPSGVTVQNNLIRGRLDLSGISGGVEFNINDGALWRFTGTNLLGAGDDALTIQEGGFVIAGRQVDGVNSNTAIIEAVDVINFGSEGSGDLFVNAGTLAVGPRVGGNLDTISVAPRHLHETELRFDDLETFRHSGAVLLGTWGFDVVDQGTDRWHDDILSMPGAHFVGEGGEILMDVNLSAQSQSGCSAALRDAVGDLPGADCLALLGGSTEGTTYLTVADVFSGDRGGYSPDGIVLVDVSGGTSAAGHFVIGPNSDHYSAANGGVVDKGLFVYALGYDETTQQHKLYGLPGEGAYQYGVMAQAAHGLWRLSTAPGLDRQADLRGDIQQGIGGGVWLRVAGEAAERDALHAVGLGTGQSITLDNSHEQSSYTVTGGIDLISGSDGDSAYVVGFMAGYAHSDMDFTSSANTAAFDGFVVGAYASFVSGGLFVDATVNTNGLEMEQDLPALGLFPAGTMVATNLLSVGGQVEAGWRIPFEGGLFVEPLAGVSYVKSEWDDVQIAAGDPLRSGLDVEFDEPTSLRAGVGGRVGFDADHGQWRTQLSVLGRVWNEFEGEASVLIRNPGDDPFISNEFSGTFTEVGVGASVYSANGTVTGFLNLGGNFANDYQAQTASVGVRLNW